MVFALPILRSEGVWPWSPHHPSSCLSTLEERRDEDMDILIPLPEESWEGGHDLCPSLLGKWKSVAMGTPILLLERRTEEGHGLYLAPIALLF